MERKDTILIACEDPQNRRQLRSVLNERYNLLESVNLRQMLTLLEYNKSCIAALVLGSSLLTGDKVRQVRTEDTDALLRRFPVMVVDEGNQELEIGEYFRWGAADVIDLSYDPYAMLRRIETITQLHLHKQHLEGVIREQADKLRQTSDKMVDVLSSIIEFRSLESGSHILRIRSFTRILMEEVRVQCPEYGLTDRAVTIVSSASALHDIGKITVPDAILNKPGPLSREEWEAMKTHTVTGCALLEALKDLLDQEYLTYARNICRYHHERWDGGGYPEGLSGDQIPICAQVVGLADAFEALIAQREYKEACTFDQAVNMILQGECGAFSLKLLECFKNVSPQFESLTQAYSQGRPPEETDYDLTLPPPAEKPEGRSLDRIRAKYYTLVHYLGAFLMEVSLDKKLFHVVYNPYPELANLEGIHTLDQLIALMLDRIVVPEERDRMAALMETGIPEFVDEDLRRSSYRFHYQPRGLDPGGAFEMTLLRIASEGPRSLALLIRKLPLEGELPQTEPGLPLVQAGYLCRNDQDFTLVSLGQDAQGLGSYPLKEIREQLEGRLSRLIDPRDRSMVRGEFTRQLRDSNLVRVEHRVLRKDGSVGWVVNKARLVLGEDGQEYLHCVLTDVTPTREAYEEIREKHRQYGEILKKTQNILFIWDVTQDTLAYSDTWQDTFAFQPSQDHVYSTLAQSSHIHPDDAHRLLDRVSSLRSGADQAFADVRIATDKGDYIWCRFRASADRDGEGKLRRIVGVISNVDADKRQEKLLQDRAERDSLTRLLNKAAGRKKVEDYLGYYPEGVRCAMVIIDLDNFKDLNDTYGHLFGDAVLTKVAREIRSQFQDQDIVCRLGGDEFMVLVRGVTDRYLLERRCRQLITALSRGIWDQYQKLAVGCSIGIALCPEHGMTYRELFLHADQALYQTKARGKNGFTVYEPGDAFPAQILGRTAVSSQIDSDEEPGLAEDTIVHHAFQLLYAAREPEDGVRKTMAYLGQKMNVSRVYIFENSPDQRHCSNTFEWCNQGIRAEIHNLQNISYETDLSGYEENFSDQGVFYCPDIAILPETAREIVAARGIKSMLQCAIRQNGVFQGYIGFDECVSQRLWTREEIRTLSYFSEVLSVFLLKYREQQRREERNADIRSLMDNQNTWIYIIDPETWELRYLNRKARSSAPWAVLGQPCFSALKGCPVCCGSCPVKQLKDKGSSRAILRDPNWPEPLLVEATRIHWEGRASCMVSVRALPEALIPEA